MAAPSTDRARAAEEDDAEETNSPSRGGIVIAVLFLVVFLGNSDLQMISPLLPLIAGDFGMTEGAVGSLIFPSYALANAAAALAVGFLSDRYGRRSFLLGAALLFGASSLAVYFVAGPPELAAVRVLTAIAAGAFSTCAIAYVGDYFPYKRRGAAMSIVQAGLFAALVIGVQVANNLANWLGWRASFQAFGLLSFVTFVLVLLLLPADKPAPADQANAAESRASNIRLVIQTRDRVASIVAAFFVSAGFLGFFSYLGSWFKRDLAFKTRDFDITFALLGVALLIGVVAAGPAGSRLGNRTISIISTIVLAVFLLVVPAQGRSFILYASLMAAALAFALRQGPLQSLATELVPREARGTLVAARNTASQVGIAVATAASGPLFDRAGFRAVGIFSAVLSLAAAACIFLIAEPGGKPRND